MYQANSNISKIKIATVNCPNYEKKNQKKKQENNSDISIY